jgi:hypothetical protein
MILAVYKELAFIAENVANIIFTIYFMVGWVERQRNPPIIIANGGFRYRSTHPTNMSNYT